MGFAISTLNSYEGAEMGGFTTVNDAYTTIKYANVPNSFFLNGAADLLDREGWIQGESRSYNGYCTLGAIAKVCGATSGQHPVFRRVVDCFFEHLVRQHGVWQTSVAYWNDQPHRTMHEVTSALRACAAIEQAREAKSDFLIEVSGDRYARSDVQKVQPTVPSSGWSKIQNLLSMPIKAGQRKEAVTPS
jgi:hypothetical protein